MRLLGLDIGERVIGVAVSDELGVTAQPVECLYRTGRRRDFARLHEICERLEVTGVVIGIPRRTDGRSGPGAEAVLALVPVLTEVLGLPVSTWDERFSTVIAERTRRELNVPRNKRRGRVDDSAAAVILQGYLDSLKRDEDRPEV